MKIEIQKGKLIQWIDELSCAEGRITGVAAGIANTNQGVAELFSRTSEMLMIPIIEEMKELISSSEAEEPENEKPVQKGLP